MSGIAEFFTDSPTSSADLTQLDELREEADDVRSTKAERRVTFNPRLAQYLVGSSHFRSRRQIEMWSSSPTMAVLSWTNALREAAPRTTASIQIPKLFIPAIPSWRTALESAIHESSWIHELSDDWDGQGAPEIARATWERAAYVLRQLADRADVLKKALPTPSIDPNGHGSIDLYWRRASKGLLVNIPASSDDPIPYSGTQNGSLLLSDQLDALAKLDVLIQFLTA
jgi:hypothetical protein